MRLVSIITLFVCGIWCSPIDAASLNGKWRYDPAQSVTEAPRQGGRSIFSNMKPTIVIQGIPVPLPGGAAQDDDESSSSPKNPDVLFCQSMTIEDDDERKRITYDRLGCASSCPADTAGARRVCRRVAWSRATRRHHAA